MFVGHIAVGFASKRVVPKASLGALMAAPMALDLLWPLFLLTGWEQVRIDPGNTAFTPLDFVFYPYSHSLAMSVVWAETSPCEDSYRRVLAQLSPDSDQRPTLC
jgi:hypothetical protein